MFCSNCGTQVPDGTVFCPNCGAKLEQTTQQTTYQQPVQQQPAPQQQTYQQPVQQPAPQQTYQQPVQQQESFEKQSNGIAVVGFIFAFIFPLLGFIFCCVGLGKSNKTHTGRGLAITGIILSIVFMIISLIVLIVSIAQGINILDQYLS